MKTYQDLQKTEESKREAFILDAISEHQATQDYKTACSANTYLKGRNETIEKYQKVVHDLTGKEIPDLLSANHKTKSKFFKIFITQEASYLLKNGVTFTKDETYDRLGKKFNTDLYKYVKSALSEKMAFGFFNLDHVDFFKYTEFVPLYDENNGALMAGIHFWKPKSYDDTMRATLYEVDGYTIYQKTKGDDKLYILKEKRPYVLKYKRSEADGMRIYDSYNYEKFPIVPLYINFEKQSELVGIREQIDAYDLIKSGFANDLDDVSQIFWILNNTGGMDDIDLIKFLDRVKTTKVAVVDNGEEGASAAPHSVEVPYQSRETYLSRLENDLYRDAMALDSKQIAAGNITATQIEASYEGLDQKTFELQNGLTEFINGILEIAGIEDTVSFNPSRIMNRLEETQMVLSASNLLDKQTILEKLPFLQDDEVDEIMKRSQEEEMARMALMQGMSGQGGNE